MTRHQARFLCQLLLAGDVALSALAFALALELRIWLPTTEAGAKQHKPKRKPHRKGIVASAVGMFSRWR